MMTIKQEPFRKYNLNENPGDITFTVRLNSEENKELFDAMTVMDIKSRGQALKILADMGKNVLFEIFPSKSRYLFKKERVRLSDLSASEIKKLANCDIIQ